MDESRPADREMNESQCTQVKCIHKTRVLYNYIVLNVHDMCMPELLVCTPPSSCIYTEKKGKSCPGKHCMFAFALCLHCTRDSCILHLSSLHRVDRVQYRRVALKGLNYIMRVMC